MKITVSSRHEQQIIEDTLTEAWEYIAVQDEDEIFSCGLRIALYELSNCKIEVNKREVPINLSEDENSE